MLQLLITETIDYLLKTGRISQEEYDEKQKEARRLLSEAKK